MSTLGLLLRALAFVCFIAAVGASQRGWIPGGLALWVLAEIAGSVP